MPNLFIAIVTGQNAANIPSIINLGNRGDFIFWIISKTASHLNWVNGSNKILRDRGFSIIPPFTIPDKIMIQPSLLSKKFIEALKKQKLSFEQIIFVMTGGQKPAVVGILLAILESRIKYKLVYQDLKPIQLMVSDESSLTFSPQEIDDALSLNEILEVYNFSIKSDGNKQPVQLFPGFQLKLTPKELFAYDQYLKDPNISLALFKLYSKFSKDNRNHVTQISFPSPENLFEQFKDSIKSWFDKSFYHLVYPYNRLGDKLNTNGKQHLKENVRSIKNDNHRKEVFSKFYKLFRDIIAKYNSTEAYVLLKEEIVEQLKKGEWLHDTYNIKVKKSDLKRRLGEFFEKMVAYRFFRFLNSHPEFKNVISEIWLNYPIRKMSAQHREFMEGDIFIVLKNATIIYLECKTFRVTEQDIFSKMERFHQVSGFVNKSYLVLPVFTDWPIEEKEYANVFNVFENLSRAGIEVVPFNGISQNKKLKIKDREIEIESFEEKLAKIFKPYLA